ncbi:MAG: ArsR/SmtB family transcription factor [Saprospiraceae bacterium]
MAFSKAHLYSNQERRVARISNSIAHPARIKILNQLRYGEMEYDQILNHHPIKKSTLSQHLRTLRLAGLIQYTLCGNTYSYHLQYENHPEWLEIILASLERPEYLRDAA